MKGKESKVKEILRETKESLKEVAEIVTVTVVIVNTIKSANARDTTLNIVSKMFK